MDENMALTPYETREILFYKTDNGDVKVEILLYQENLWLTQAKMAELFEVCLLYTSNRFLSKLFFTLSDEQKEVLYYLFVKQYSTTRLAAIRGQSDRNIRTVSYTHLF